MTAATAPFSPEMTRRAAKIRALFVSDAINSRNGVGTYYQDLVDHLGDYLDHSELVCPGNNGSSDSLGISWAMPGDNTQRVYLPNLSKLSRRMTRAAPHVVIISTPGPYGLAAALLARRKKISLCVGYHTELEKLADIYWSGVTGRVGTRSLKWLHNLLFRQAEVVFANNDELTESAQRIGARKVRVMGTPIARAFLVRSSRPSASKLQTVLFAGRLAREKNLGTVIEAAAALGHIQFVIAGDGPFRKHVEGAAATLPNLKYVGWVARPELVELLDECDMLVLPSRVESFGTVAVEAMARRKMVLVSRSCGLLRWPALAETVFAMEPDEGLADALRRVEKIPEATLAARTEAGYERAQDLHVQTLAGWFDMLSAFADPNGRPGR